jgi:hypothetical protein
MSHALICPLLTCLLAAVPSPASRPRPASPPIPLPAASGWARSVDHPYFPLRPGAVFVYATREGARTDVDTMSVMHETKTILGIAAVVVRDRTFHDGALAEDTMDWYAQDAAGNVWYLGEDTKEYRGGKLFRTAGSWEAGRDGAQPGIVMWAHPQVGGPYRQEFRRGVAEDLARVLSVHARASNPGVTYEQCVQTEEWSPLEPGVREHKFYARGVGMVRMQAVAGGD